MRYTQAVFMRGKFYFAVLICLLTTLIVSGLFTARSSAVSGINQQMNYQARLLDSTGATVPDGTYNIRFKIYCDGDGALGGSDPGTCSDHATAEHLLWTETRTGGDKVTVVNGYFNVQLGSVTAFGSSVDWNQSKLWLSIDIGGTGTPTWDGEMSPFRRLSASPYALNAGQLGGRSSAEFLQLAPASVQTDSSTSSSVFVNKTGASGNVLQFQKNSSDVLALSNGGSLTHTYTGTTANAHSLTANSLTTGSALNVTSSSNSAANTAWSGVSLNVTNAQSTTAVSTGTIAGLDLQFTQNATVAGNTETVANLALKQNDASATDNTVSSIINLANNDTATGNQITVTDGLKVNGANVTNGINLSGTFGSNLITSTNFGVAQSGSITSNGTYNTNTFTSNSLQFGGASTATIQSAGSQALTLTSNAAATWSTSAGTLTVQGAAGLSLLAGTANATIGTSDATGTLLVLDTKTGSGDPTGVNGGMYYNSNTGKFRCYQGGAWTDCIGSSTCSVSGTFVCSGGNTLGAALTLGTNDNFGLNFEVNNATVMSINTSGQVGIGGTPDAESPLFVAKNGAFDTRITVENTNASGFTQLAINSNANRWLLGTAGGSASDASDFYIFDDLGGYRMRISNDTGNVALGAVASVDAANALHVDAGTAGAAIEITNGATSGRTGTDGLQLTLDGSSNGYLTNWENSTLNLGTNALTRMTILASGFVGVGLTNPGQELEVQGDIRLDSNGTQTLFGLCHSGADADTTFTNRDIVACSGAQSGVNDYAEFYPTDPDVTYGDVVMLSDTIVETYAFNPDGTPDKTKKVKMSRLSKSATGSQQKLVGVVSNNYTDFQSIGRAVLEDDHHPLPIALSGRVPVKVSAENGPIAPGDALTASSIPGVAMKATQPGMVIGRAMAPYADSGVGQIMVFVNNYFYNPPASGTQGDTGQSIQNGSSTNIANLNVSGLAKLARLQVTGDAQIEGDLTVKGLTNIQQLVINGHIITAGKSPTITAQQAAGKGARATITGNDTAGVITVVTGNSPSAELLAKINFHRAFEGKPNVLLTPVGRKSATLDAYVEQSTVDKFTIGAGTTPEPNQTYSYNYHVLQ